MILLLHLNVCEQFADARVCKHKHVGIILGRHQLLGTDTVSRKEAVVFLVLGLRERVGGGRVIILSVARCSCSSVRYRLTPVPANQNAAAPSYEDR